MAFSLPKSGFVSDLFAQLRKTRAKFSEPRLFDLLFVALVIFSFGVALCLIGVASSGWEKRVGTFSGFGLIIIDACFLCGVYLWLLLQGKATNSTERDTERGLRKVKAQHVRAKRKAAQAAASAIPGSAGPVV